MTHVCELDLETLKTMLSELYGSESTDDNMRRIHALEKQIARKERGK